MAVLGGPFVDQFPLVCRERDLVDFDDAPGGGAGRALDGDDALVGVHVQELAAREILAAAEGMSPLLRSVAVRVVERLGEDALPAWRR